MSASKPLIAAVIPARAGSKRIVGKNTQPLGSLRLIEWTMRFAAESGLFKRVIVSTDDPIVQELSKKWGLDVWIRSEATDDFATVSDVVLDVMENFDIDEEITHLAVLLPTCPFRSFRDVREMLSEYSTQAWRGSLLSCVEPLGLQMGWAFERDGRGRSIPVDPENWSKRSQDLANLYSPSGAFWISDKESLVRSRSYHGELTDFYPVSFLSGFDIDSWDDLNFARLIVDGIGPDGQTLRELA